MPRSNQRGSKNNNPEGRNQYSNGWMDTARESPMRTAVTAAAAVGAGVFLWSRRNQISDQISNLSNQIGDWSDNMRSGSNSGDGEFEMAGGNASFGNSASAGGSTGSTTGSSRSTTNRTGASMTGGGRKGAASGGSGIDSGASGRTGA